VYSTVDSGLHIDYSVVKTDRWRSWFCWQHCRSVRRRELATCRRI